MQNYRVTIIENKVYENGYPLQNSNPNQKKKRKDDKEDEDHTD